MRASAWIRTLPLASASPAFSDSALLLFAKFERD